MNKLQLEKQKTDTKARAQILKAFKDKEKDLEAAAHTQRIMEENAEKDRRLTAVKERIQYMK